MKRLLRILPLCLGVSVSAQVAPPTPFGPVPSARQLEWQKMEIVGFAHFTVDTFTGKEWGYGDESENTFNPTAFDPAQIVRTAREAGMKELILTCKHHDGFCLWPSKFTEHSVKNSAWKNGHGDVVRAISDECKKQGLKFGVYLSPWDRNSAIYATPEYITYYRNQLTELLTQYAPVSEVWFDGANGGDGFYGGKKEKRSIDNKTYYDWPNTIKLVRDLAPMACMFSDAGPDIRWVGNENGVAGETCWETLNRSEFYPGNADENRLNHGDRPGTDWLPAECDVSIRPGWFYHENENDHVKTGKQLLDLYFKSVGRGATMLLNIPPDQRGQIPDSDVFSLLEFARLRKEIFAHDLAQRGKFTASNVRGNSSEFAAKNLRSHKNDSYWTTDDSILTPEVTVEFSKPTTFNVVRVREHLPLGQRVEAFAVDAWQDGQWKQIADATSIGNCRLLRIPDTRSDKIRLRITKAAACPALSEFAVFYAQSE